MSDAEPMLRIELSDGSEILLTRDNATLFTFIGKTMLQDVEVEADTFNHIFISNGEQDTNGVTMGKYIFENSRHYDDIADFMIDNHYPLIMNMLEVADCDKAAWVNANMRDLEDINGVPEEWLE